MTKAKNLPETINMKISLFNNLLYFLINFRLVSLNMVNVESKSSSATHDSTHAHMYIL